MKEELQWKQSMWRSGPGIWSGPETRSWKSTQETRNTTAGPQQGGSDEAAGRHWQGRMTEDQEHL